MKTYPPPFSRWINFEHARQSYVSAMNRPANERIAQMESEYDSAIADGDISKAGRIEQSISRIKSTLVLN